MVRPSTFGVVSVATIPAPTLGPFYVAPSDSWIRLLVRNVGGNPVYLAFVTNAANTANVTTDRYELPAGMSDAIILAPTQLVCAVSPGGSRLTYAASVALPVTP
jgi:hypothetical protein